MVFRKEQIQQFHDDTTIHGFKQLYYAGPFWKFFWFVVIVGFACTTGFQIYLSISDILQYPTVTVSQPLSQETYEKPTLDFCVPLNNIELWLNASSVETVGLDALMYAVTKIIPSYKSPCNVGIVSYCNSSSGYENYMRYLSDNNIYNEFTFFKNVANSWAPFVGDIDSMNIIVSKTNFINDYFCYALKILKNKAIKFQLSDAPKRLKYFQKLFNVSVVPISFSTNVNPKVGVANINGMVLTTGSYVFDLSANKYIWLNKDDAPCNDTNDQTMLSRTLKELNENENGLFDYCEEICSFKYYLQQKCSGMCLDFNVSTNLQYDDMENITLCGKPISDLHVPSLKKCDYVVIPGDYQGQCQCSKSCTQWIYSSQVSKDEISSTGELQVKVNYPSHRFVIENQEQFNYSWTDLIANVGGLLGLWLGASIMSLIEIFYFCCCYQPEKTSTDVVPIK